jgi:hypothetical protein
VTSEISLFGVGALGALAAELLKAYELRGKLTTVKYRRLAKSPLYWGVFAGMLLSSGFIAWAVNSPLADPEPLNVILTGIGARGLIQGASSGAVANAGARLGGNLKEREASVTVRDIFA